MPMSTVFFLVQLDSGILCLWSSKYSIYGSITKKKKSDFTVTVGDFNVRSTTWWSGDITTTEGTNIEALTSYQGFEQVINEPTHILPNSASCIDLIFADKSNLIVESGMLPSLYVKYHHQIIFSKLNLNVVYPPPYQHLIWDYKKSNVDCIQNLWIHLIGTFFFLI